ncbi:MAG TPA: hypothetical protein VN213_00350 [Solirubrobacteraceae bacterium]|nr:hypothetical protein [Solirubrobacteraceae bacterium]
MVAAAATLWAMFSLWLVGPLIGLTRTVERTAAGIFMVELVTLLAWSYGTESCDGAECGPLARAAGVAARVDIPIFAGLVVVAVTLRLRRSGLRLEGRP